MALARRMLRNKENGVSHETIHKVCKALCQVFYFGPNLHDTGSIGRNRSSVFDVGDYQSGSCKP